MDGAGGAGLVRAARLGAFTVCASLLALGAHLAAGGAPPAAVPTLAAVALSGLAGVALTRRRPGRLELAVVLGAVQLVVHEILAAAGTGHAGHAVAAGHAGDAVAAGHAGASGAVTGVAMLAAHALSVLLTALLLARGERMLHRLLRSLRSLPALVGRARPPRPLARSLARPAAVAAGDPPSGPPSRRACAPVVRRGPPLPCG